MFDATADFEQIVDGLETVTHITRAGVETTITGALRRAVQAAEPSATAGMVTQQDCVWRLPVTELALQPELGSTLQDAAGQHWTILEVEANSLCGQWRCRARNLAIALGLEARIALDRPQFGRDSSGAPTITWQLWRANLPARIQPVARSTDFRDRVLADVASHVVLLAESDFPTAGLRVRELSGRTFEVLRIERAERLGELTQLHVRQLA